MTDIENNIASGFELYSSAAEVERWIACAATASDCSSAYDCIFRHHGSDYCAAHPGTSCDGNVFVACGQMGFPTETGDCGALGETCVLSPYYVCTDGKPCDPKQPQTCDGNAIGFCDPNTRQLLPMPCSDLGPGASCQLINGSASCVRPGPSCSKALGTALRCDGNTLIVCDGKTEVAIDCDALEGQCSGAGGNFACHPRASECADAAPYRCNGNSLELCVNGRYQEVDCSSLGFATCAANSNGFGCTK